MKFVWVTLLTVTTALLLVSCGGAGATPTASTPTSVAATATTTSVPASGTTGTPGANGGGRNGSFGGRLGINSSELASFFGITSEQLQSEEQSGKTLAQIAPEHGKTTDQLKTYMQDQAKTSLDQAVKDGKLTQDQENNELSQLSQRIDSLINGQTNGQNPGQWGGFAANSNELASFFGITPQELQTERQSGKTLAQIAQEQGKTTDELKTYIYDQTKATLDQSVKDGTITQEQEDSQLAQLNQRIDSMINGQFNGQNRQQSGGSGTPQPTDYGTATPSQG